MKRLQMAVAGMMVAVLVCSSALAADKAKKEKKNKPDPMPGVQAALGLLKGLELTEEQKTKVKEIGTTYNDKFTALKAKQQAATPAEALKARQEAQAKAKAEGKKGKDLKAAVDAAAPVSDEQKAAMKAVQEEMKTLNKELKDSLLSILTEDQRTKLNEVKPKKEKKNK